MRSRHLCSKLRTNYHVEYVITFCGVATSVQVHAAKSQVGTGSSNITQYLSVGKIEAHQQRRELFKR